MAANLSRERVAAGVRAQPLVFYRQRWWLVARCLRCGGPPRRSAVAWIEEHWPGLTVGQAAARLRCAQRSDTTRLPCRQVPVDVWLEPMDDPDPELRVAVFGVGTR